MNQLTNSITQIGILIISVTTYKYFYPTDEDPISNSVLEIQANAQSKTDKEEIIENKITEITKSLKIPSVDTDSFIKKHVNPLPEETEKYIFSLIWMIFCSLVIMGLFLCICSRLKQPKYTPKVNKIYKPSMRKSLACSTSCFFILTCCLSSSIFIRSLLSAINGPFYLDCKALNLVETSNKSLQDWLVVIPVSQLSGVYKHTTSHFTNNIPTATTFNGISFHAKIKSCNVSYYLYMDASNIPDSYCSSLSYRECKKNSNCIYHNGWIWGTCYGTNSYTWKETPKEIKGWISKPLAEDINTKVHITVGSVNITLFFVLILIPITFILSCYVMLKHCCSYGNYQFSNDWKEFAAAYDSNNFNDTVLDLEGDLRDTNKCSTHGNVTITMSWIIIQNTFNVEIFPISKCKIGNCVMKTETKNDGSIETEYVLRLDIYNSKNVEITRKKEEEIKNLIRDLILYQKLFSLVQFPDKSALKTPIINDDVSTKKEIYYQKWNLQPSADRAEIIHVYKKLIVEYQLRNKQNEVEEIQEQFNFLINLN